MRKVLPPLILALLLVGCGDTTPTETPTTDAPWVRTVAVKTDDHDEIRASGTIRGHYETPVSFQVSGRILKREVDAGQKVASGALLFELDKRDLEATMQVAKAELQTAQVALAIAQNELDRQRQLIERNFVSRQTLEAFELALQNAESRRDSAKAVLSQAQNGLSYAELRADKSGVLAEVTGEPGMVVGVGQPVALLVEDGDLEVEVFLSDGNQAPESGVLKLQEQDLPLRLREVAGAADPESRSWKARYRIEAVTEALNIGTVVQVALNRNTSDVTFEVPLGALDERNQGPQIWQVVGNTAQPVSVEVLELKLEYATIRAPLNSESRVIAVGTHLLEPRMAVREQAR